MRAQLSTLMSQVGSNLRSSQLHPLRPSYTDQSQGSKLSQFLWKPDGRRTEDGQKTKSTVEVRDPTGTPPKKIKLSSIVTSNLINFRSKQNTMI